MIEKCGQKIKRPGEVKRGTKEQNIANTIDEETGDWTLDTGSLLNSVKPQRFLLKHNVSKKEKVQLSNDRTF